MQASSGPIPARHTPRIVASLILLSALAGCGYKGPLYHPRPPAPKASLTKPPSTVPLPAGNGADATTTPADISAVK